MAVVLDLDLMEKVALIGIMLAGLLLFVQIYEHTQNTDFNKICNETGKCYIGNNYMVKQWIWIT